MNELSPPADVKEAFLKLAEGGDQMSAYQLRRFLEEHQDEVDSTVADADRIIKHVLNGRHEAYSAKQSLSLADFFHFLFLDDLNGPIKSQVHLDMTAPLSHYFIYTGHNSYLTGNQLSGDCSDVPLIKALQRGVKRNSDPDDEDINGCVHRSAQEGAPEYKRLITIHAGKPKGSLKDALQVEADKVRRLSLSGLSEQALEKAASNHGTDVVRFMQKNILRIYPKGTRVISSNYKQHVGWMHGAQMVAFNMQIHIVGVPTDAAKKKTRIIDDDWAPPWDEEFEFPLTVPDLALLRIEVREYDRSEKDNFGGQTCFPISELRPRIRAVPLYDRMERNKNL